MFGDLFTYEDCVTTENRVIYTDVVLMKDIGWNHDIENEIEAVFDFVNGILYFGEYVQETQVYNKSKNFNIFID